MTSEKLLQKLHFKKYLAELSVLVGRDISSENLLSLEQTKAIRQASLKFDTQPKAQYRIPFSEKSENRFRSFIQRLSSANSSSIFVFTPRTITCGVFPIASLEQIKWEFDFSINGEGILGFLTEDICDSLLLDFSESDFNQQELTVEVKGHNWLSCRFD